MCVCVHISLENMLASQKDKLCGESKASQAGDSTFSCALLSLLASGGWVHHPLEEYNCKLSLFAFGNEVFMV